MGAHPHAFLLVGEITPTPLIGLILSPGCVPFWHRFRFSGLSPTSSDYLLLLFFLSTHIQDSVDIILGCLIVSHLLLGLPIFCIQCFFPFAMWASLFASDFTAILVDSRSSDYYGSSVTISDIQCLCT